MEYQYRQVTEFLYLPKRIDGKIKWLSTQTWIEERKLEMKFNWFNMLSGYEPKWSKWSPIKWKANANNDTNNSN